MLRPYIYLTPNITPSGAGAVAALGTRFPNAAPPRAIRSCLSAV